MYNLEELQSGSSCTIIWLLGNIGKFLQDNLHLSLDDEINVLYNDGKSLIIKHHNKKYALDSLSAHSIKVVLA